MPTTLFNAKNCVIITDPNDQFPDTHSHILLNAGGYLTQWVMDYFIHEDKSSLTLKDHMQEAYGQGGLSKLNITLHPDNHLSYPNDPDMHPLIVITQPERIQPLQALIYQYGIIVLMQGGETFITRMD